MSSEPMQVTIHRGGPQTTMPGQATAPVQVEDLVCAGCHDQAVPRPPQGWPCGAGAPPEFSHRDGSVLCPDARGRLGEPVEAGLHGAGVQR